MAVPRSLTEEERQVTEADDKIVKFSGWMFASSPGLMALEDPVYDIWVIACSTAAPVVESVVEFDPEAGDPDAPIIE